MAAVHRGFGAALGFGVESTWGTPVARTNWLRPVSVGLRRTRTKPPIGHLGDLSQVSTVMKEFFVESDFAGGPISWEMAYDDSTVLLCRHAFGTNVDAGAGPFTHTLTLSDPPPTGLTIEQISGTPATGNMAEVFEGCLVNSAVFSVEAGKLMMAEFDIIGETSGGVVAAGSPSQNTTRERIAHNHAGTITLQGTACPVRSAKFTINRNLERNHELGSLFTQVPVPGGIELEIETTVLWQSSQWLTNYYADTTGNLTWTFTGTSSRSLAITAHNCLITDRGAPVQTKGGILETLKLRPQADATNQGFSFVFTNANATHLIN